MFKKISFLIYIFNHGVEMSSNSVIDYAVSVMRAG